MTACEVPDIAIRAAAELELRRRRRVQTFGSFLRETSPHWNWDWPHLVHMQDQLADITAGRLRFLMQFCPPRHGKTEQNTVRYAAYRLKRDPSCRIIIAAYNQGLAKKFSRKVHKLAKACGVQMDPGHQALDDWATTSGGGVRAVGVGSGVTGAGADLIIIDDPVKSRAEANSKAYQDRCWDWFTDDLFTRLEPGGSILLTLTRWHIKDLAGKIQESELAADWRVVNLPAIAEENDPLGRAVGEALCPDRYPIEELERRKRLMRGNFWALFQGQPRAPEGNQFKRTWFRYWTRDEKAPDLIRLIGDDGRSRVVKLADCRIFTTCDPATTARQSADFTVFSTWAVTPSSDLILLDRWRDQVAAPDALKAAFELMTIHHPSHFSVGANGIGTPLIQNMRRGLINEDGSRTPGLPVRAVNESTDKLTKATTAIIRTEAGQVYFPAHAPWLSEWETELLNFSGEPGNTDDQVDTLSLAAEEVFWSGGAPELEEERLAREDAQRDIEAEERAAELEARRDNPEDPIWWDQDDEL